MSDSESLYEQVWDALRHLYDYPHLEEHPLALRCCPEIRPRGPGRAQRLSRLLLETIEALHPPTSASQDTSRARAYSILAYRYVEERASEDIMQELCLSRRQFFREQQKAIAMLAASLQDRLPLQATPSAHSDDLLTDDLLTDDLLTVEAQRVLTHREAVDLAELVTGVLEAVGPLVEQRGVELDLDLDADLPPLQSSRTLLRQIFLKALNSVISQSDGRYVRLQMRQQEHWAVIALVVQAREPGVRGCQGTECTAPDFKLVQHLIEMVNGRWHGVEDIDQGYACRFAFPVGGKDTLLVVEDNQAVIRAFCRYVIGYDYHVVGASSGAEALQLARELQPRAITLDVLMPNQDGWEVLQALKGDPATRHIPVIVCSVLEDPELVQSLGAAAYLPKPVVQAELLSTLDRLIHES